LKILALDTSTDHCSVALWLDGASEVRETRAGQSHSSIVLGMIDEVLGARGVKLRELDAIAFGEGPGSFTGLRIACGVVQGLAFGADVPVVGVGTLLAMAEGTQADSVVCCVDARVHEIYHGAYSRVINPASKRTAGTEGSPRYPLPSVEKRWLEVCAPSLCAPAAAPALEGGGWLGCGSGFAAYRDALEARYRGQLVAVEPERYPHARDIAALAVPRVERGEVYGAEAAAPVYLRDKVALRIDERATR
jgi:tRNA threonylcarbamoyladenosine biosynthesis protein TsaB